MTTLPIYYAIKLIAISDMLFGEWAFYLAISGVLFYSFIKGLFYLAGIREKYPCPEINGLRLFWTSEPGSPFSFFYNIFWSDRLEIRSEFRKQILRKEIYHVRQYHVLDIFCPEIVNCLICFNPFYFLIKKEMRLVHAYLADEYPSSGNDSLTYAEFLVRQKIRAARLSLTNTFFHQQIKRRIAMITRKNNRRYFYAGRFLILPLLEVLFCAFGTTVKSALPGQILALMNQSPAETNDSSYKEVENYLLRNLHYPAKGLDENASAAVNVKIVIDNSGHCRSAEAIESIPADSKYFEIRIIGKPRHSKSIAGKPIRYDYMNPGFSVYKEQVTKTLSAFRLAKPGRHDITMFFRVLFQIGKERSNL